MRWIKLKLLPWYKNNLIEINAFDNNNFFKIVN